MGLKRTQVCVLDAAGEVVSEARVTTTRSALRLALCGMEQARVAMEVCTQSPWVSTLVAELGHEVVVANARQVKLIYASDRKTDRRDAEALARLLRADPELLRPIKHRGRTSQSALNVIKSRDLLVATRTKLCNHVRGVVRASGATLSKCSVWTMPGVADSMPDELRIALDPVLEQIAQLNGQIRALDKRVEQLCKEVFPDTAALRQVNGVGALTALAFVTALEDPHRFRNNRSLGAYLGLCPKVRQSCDSDPQLRITKSGDKLLRRLLVQCANYILGPHAADSDLRRWGLAYAERGGRTARARAKVAVARKLGTLLLALWKTGEVYEPLRKAEGTVERAA